MFTDIANQIHLNKTNISNEELEISRRTAERLYIAATCDIESFPSLDEVRYRRNIENWKRRLEYLPSCSEGLQRQVVFNLRGIELPSIAPDYEIMDFGNRIEIAWYKLGSWDWRVCVRILLPRLETLQRLNVKDLSRCNYWFQGHHWSDWVGTTEALMKAFPILHQIMAGAE